MSEAHTIRHEGEDPQPVAFSLVPITIGRYREHPPLPVETEAAAILEVLKELGDPQVRPAPQKVTGKGISNYLWAWAQESGPGPKNSFVYWAGHGRSAGRRAFLAHKNTDRKIRTGIRPADLADVLRAESDTRDLAAPQGWAVVAIEACGAAGFVRLLASDLDADPQTPERLVVIGVGGEGQTDLGVFRQALGCAIASYEDHDIEVRIGEFALRVEGFLGQAEVRWFRTSDAAPLPRVHRWPAGAAPRDVYGELRKVLPDLSADVWLHFFPKAQGAEHGEFTWHFVGRAKERAQLVMWLRASHPGMHVVTGKAGSGKSALLGSVFVDSIPPLRQALVDAGHLTALGKDQLPPAGVFNAVLHLTGRTVVEVVALLSAAAGIEPEGPPVARSSESSQAVDPAERLLDRLRARSSLLTVLVDAVDEAEDPLGVAAFLRRLARLPAVRLVVGARASTSEGPDHEAPDDRDILDALGAPASGQAAGRYHVLEVRRDPGVIREYIRSRLRARAAELNVDEATIGEVAGAVKAKDKEVLFARLLVHEILARPELLRQPQLDTELPRLLEMNHRQLFSTAVDRLERKDPAFGPLLAGLAFARGRGVPRGYGVWGAVAEAVSGDRVRITQQDIGALLEAAAPYVMLDGEDGQSVYRLSHRTFQEHFLQP